MTHEDRFRAYIDAFNRSDFDALRGFYAPDIRLVIGNGTELVGRDAIVDFYRPVKAATQRTIEVLHCFYEDGVLAAELESEFLALQDLPDFVAGPMRKGDRRYLNSVVFYEIDGDQYTRIRAAVLRREYRPVAG
jgi:hypothetical protein